MLLHIARKTAPVLAALFLTAGLALGQEETPKPTLPQGHPPLNGGQSAPGLPEGHPALPGGGAMGQMPSGHAQIGQDGPMAKDGTGTLFVKAIQGTPGGKDVAGDKVVVQLMHQNVQIGRVEATIDQYGVAMIQGIDLPVEVQPIVSVTHDGNDYQTTGDPMSAKAPDQIVRLKVYETTTDEPQWNIAMRHVMLHTTESGLEVQDIHAVNNPADHAWKPLPVAEGQPATPTVTLPVPLNAKDIKIGTGFHECCTRIENNHVIGTMPLNPGPTRYGIAYTLPVTDSKATLTLSVTKPTDHMMAIIPDDGSTVTAQGITFSRTLDMHGSKVRLYNVDNPPVGQPITLTIEGLKPPVEPHADPSATPDNKSSNAAHLGATAPGDEAKSSNRVIAGVGAGVMVAVAVGVVMLKKPATKP
ncbi:MAG: hypothetical protein GC164_03175 [Phycisphaera sp.]|nr:hypothetical protein [Phycisphaera sp.]